MVNLFFLCCSFCLISFSSQSNQNVTKAVIEALVADQGGTENCPWSPAEMKSMLLHDCVILTISRHNIHAGVERFCNVYVAGKFVPT